VSWHYSLGIKMVGIDNALLIVNSLRTLSGSEWWFLRGKRRLLQDVSCRYCEKISDAKELVGQQQHVIENSSSVTASVSGVWGRSAPPENGGGNYARTRSK
jgi:hypothetical protein